MESAIRFSQNSPPDGTEQRFISVDKASQVVGYDVIASSAKVPPFRAFDWHPHLEHESLIAVGQSSGEATLISLISPGETDPGALSFQVRSQRPCNAVSLSADHLLAAGLDRVRTDFCLNIWDFSQRIQSSPATTPKSPSIGRGAVEPLHKLAAGDAITSLKFFPTSPLHLIAGSKSQWVRLYDLREAGSVSNSGLQFNTRCVHNLAIDPRDENFIASCFPSGDNPGIALWDRRMMARGSVSTSYSMHEGRQPESSLELKNAIDAQGNIWSLRFSKSKRGCLGVLSSSGQLKVYEMGKDSVVEEFRSIEENESEWEVQLPQEVFLDQSHDIERPFPTNGKRDEKARVVSFDFTTSQSRKGQPCLITLNGHGEIRTVTTSPKPEPTILHPSGFLMHGSQYIKSDLTSAESLSEAIQAIKSKAEPHNPQRQAFSEAKAKGQAGDRKSSFENQTWRADLGFHEPSSSIRDVVSLTSLAQYRCQNGYMLDPDVNKKLAVDNKWLSGFWSWCSWAQQLYRSSALTQDNLDLSYLGVYSIWMEDLPSSALATRSLGPSQHPSNSRLSKTIEALVRRLQLPATRHVSTEYRFNRQLCLYVSNLAWTTSELDTWTASLASSNKHSKAAFLALLSGNRSLAIRCLRAKGSNQTHHFIALAISNSGVHKPRPTSTQDQTNLDSDDESTSSTSPSSPSLRQDLLTDTLATTTEPFSRAMLTYLSTASWPGVLSSVTSLPIRYRLALALRHLNDQALSSWISQTTTAAVNAGDLEGIPLTGTGTPQSVTLLQNYAARFTDLQTAVCALAVTVPRYVRDPSILRVYNAMRETYRAEMMSWGGESMLDRVQFDVACARAAKDNVSGEGMVKVKGPQVRLVCSVCNGGWAHHEVGAGRQDGVGVGEEENGGRGEKQMKTQQQQTATANASNSNAAIAAALGTVCPNCGRKMSRCGVCDGFLGQEDPSFMKWFAKQHGEHRDSMASVVVGEKMAGSVGTIVSAEGRRDKGKRQKGSTGSKGSLTGLVGITEDAVAGGVHGVDDGEQEREEEIERLRVQDEMMSRFTVVCVKCSHGFHYAHARKWFEGDPEAGTALHRFCPVPRCECFCWEG